jgi:hypothetical protein
MDLKQKIHSLLAQSTDKVDAIFAPLAVGEASEHLFKELPVDFKTFIESAEHMNFPALSERQLDVARFMLGTDPYKAFENENTLAVLDWGKGSGKDSLACLIILYIVYYCLCLKDPQKFFGLPNGEPIDLLNVAYSADQAQQVFFEKFRQRVLRWHWLKRRYSIKVSGAYLKQIKEEELLSEQVVIIRDGILFPNLIRAFSGHSQQESLEGRNLLAWVMDEAAAFKDKTETHNADKIFGVLQSSATSRFSSRWKGFILSYPRYKGDFIEKMYELAESELHWYSDKGATWEIKPLKCFSGRWVTFEGIKIPREFEKEFRRNPQEAKCRYMCLPPEVEQAFMEYPEKIEACIDYNRQPLVTFESFEEDNYTKKRITEIHSVVDSTEYVVTVDLGLSGDSAAFSIFHRELSPEGTKFIQDAVTAWIPDRARNILVFFPNIEEMISILKKRINITGVFFDQWQSTTLIQRLSQAQIHSEQYKLDFQDYKNFKERIYAKQVSLLPYLDQIREMKKLVLLKGGKVDHLREESKDLCDTVVGALKILTSDGKGKGVAFSEGGEFVGENLGKEGSFL